MTERAATRRPGLGTAGVIVAGIAILASGLGPAVAEADWRLGARLAPFDWQVQTRAANEAIAAKDAATAIASAYRALIANPLNAKALTIVGATRGGKVGTTLLNQSAALGWRDPLTNSRLVVQALREGDPVIAAQRTDAIGRTGPADRAATFADQVILMRGGIDAMAERASYHLGRGWMPDWLATPPKSPALVTARSELVSRIEASDGPWKRVMIQASGEGFSKANDPAAAYALWRRNLDGSVRIEGAVYDPLFTAADNPASLIWEWQTVASSPFTAERTGQGGLVLTATSEEIGAILSQAAPARPRLTLQAAWSGDRTAVGAMVWRYGCLGTGESTVQQPALTRTADGWVQTATFALSPSCRIGVLSLEARFPLAPQTKLTLRRVMAG